ncbi:hypothetical protein RSAG8_04829, partial [Rhizoctonia solani AG-8 WAC10335]
MWNRSLAMHSDCTFFALEQYFLHDKLPQNEVCSSTNQELFPKTGITKNTLSNMQRAN